MNIQDRIINCGKENTTFDLEIDHPMKIFSSPEVLSSKGYSIKEEVFTIDDCAEDASNTDLNEQKFKPYGGNISSTEYFAEESTETLYCENCRSLCQDFCLKCCSSLFILHNEMPRDLDDNTEKTIPQNILVIKEIKNQKGIFALRTIPKGVQFGPFVGLTISRKGKGYIWKLSHGKLIPEQHSQHLNWMQHVRSVKDASHQNLTTFQYKGELFFRSSKEIVKGSELLVHYGLENAKYTNDSAPIHYRPRLERKLKNIYACTFCCIGFSSEVTLVRHKSACPHETIRNSIFNIITQCPICQIYLLEREYRELHSRYCNKLNANISSAPQLDYVVSDEEENNEALNTSATVITNVDKKYSCLQCEFRSSSKDHLVQHASVHKKRKKLFVCETCNKQFTKSINLEIHLKNKHNLNCTLKSKSNHSNIKRYQCDICSKHFDRNDRLQFHIKDKHSDSKDKTYKCTKCPYQTNIKKCLQVHLYRHSDEKPYACEVCGAQFIQNQYLQLHTKKMHTATDERLYNCSKCSYSTDRKNNMRRHMSTHFVNPDVKIYKCSQCSFESIHPESLTRHRYVHDEIKRYECNVCKQRFNFRQNLTVHVKYVHNVVEENYSCSKCSYQTNRKDSLNRHLFTHGGMRPYQCKFCNKQFVRNVNLMQHINKVHKEIL